MADREKLIALLKSNQAVLQAAGISATATLRLAEQLLDNGVKIPVLCKECKHWTHMEDGFGDCTHPRLHIPGITDPTMEADGFCSCGERRTE